LLSKDAPNLSPNVIVRLKEKWSQKYEAWSRRDLSQKHYLYVWADGIYRQCPPRARRKSPAMPVGSDESHLRGKEGADRRHRRYRESEQNWTELLLDLQLRGLSEAPLLAVADGAVSFWAALRKGKMREQPYWVHKTANLLNKMPKRIQPKAKAGSARSGRPRPARARTRRSITSWRNVERSTTPLATAWPRIATCC
jgi:putative transposase